jgi:hypothetical protein
MGHSRLNETPVRRYTVDHHSLFPSRQIILNNNIITNSQSGFTKGDSAIHQLINITNEFGKALDEDKEVRVIFCDISIFIVTWGIYFENESDVDTFPISRKYSSSKR